jgi:hypothetical protein
LCLWCVLTVWTFSRPVLITEAASTNAAHWNGWAQPSPHQRRTTHWSRCAAVFLPLFAFPSCCLLSSSQTGINHTLARVLLVLGCSHRCRIVAPSRNDRPQWEVADIFSLYGDPSRQTQEVSAAQQKAIDAIIACRTAQLGGHVERCPQCGFARYAESACRNRHCPTWQTWPQAHWVEAQRAELLPTPSFHTVCTVPHDLTSLILGTTRLLLTFLCRTASHSAHLASKTWVASSARRWLCTPETRRSMPTSTSTVWCPLARWPSTARPGCPPIRASSSRCGP